MLVTSGIRVHVVPRGFGAGVRFGGGEEATGAAQNTTAAA